jgi:hypothetical protein
MGTHTTHKRQWGRLIGLVAWAAIPFLVTVWSLAEVVSWPGGPEPGACYQRMEGIRFCITTPPDQRGHAYDGRNGVWIPGWERYRYQHQT